MFNVVSIVLGQFAQVKALRNVAEEATDNIAQKKILCMLS